MISNTLRLDFCCLKIIHFLHLRCHPKIVRHILKTTNKNKYVCIHEIIQLMIMKIKMKIKNRSKRYDIVLGLDMDVNIVDIDISVIMLACIKQRLSNI